MNVFILLFIKCIHQHQFQGKEEHYIQNNFKILINVHSKNRIITEDKKEKRDEIKILE